MLTEVFDALLLRDHWTRFPPITDFLRLRFATVIEILSKCALSLPSLISIYVKTLALLDNALRPKITLDGFSFPPAFVFS